MTTENFSEIAEDLEAQIEGYTQKAQERKRRRRRKLQRGGLFILFAMLAFLVLVFLGDGSDDAEQYVVSGKDYAYNWDYEAFDALNIAIEKDWKKYDFSKASGRDHIFETMGYPEDASQYEDEQTFDYFSPDLETSNQYVTLEFWLNDGHYYLTEKTMNSPSDVPYAVTDEDIPDYDLTAEIFGKLAVGDSQTGQGGMTYQALVDQLGKPTETLIRVTHDVDEGLKTTVEARYKIYVNYKTVLDVTFDFVQIGEGEMLLAEKNAQTLKPSSQSKDRSAE